LKEILESPSTSASTNSAYEVVQGLLSPAAGAEELDGVYDGLLGLAGELRVRELGLLTDLLKRALLRYVPSLEQLGRTNEWCQETVTKLSEAENGGAGGGEEGGHRQRTELVNSLKFLRRLVRRNIDKLKEGSPSRDSKPKPEPEVRPSTEASERAEAPAEREDEGGESENRGRGGLESARARYYPHSALSQLRANADNTRRRSSTYEVLTHERARSNLSLLSNAEEITGIPEREQSSLFGDLLGSKTKTVAELGSSIKLALAHMIDMYEKDSQQAFVILSIFMQEMLLDHSVEIQKRAFDIFINLVVHWQVLETRQYAEEGDAGAERQQMAATRRAWMLKDSLWHMSLLNEMCLVLLDRGNEVDDNVWACAHSCLLLCCTDKGLLVPKLVKLVHFDILKRMLEVSQDKFPARESSIVSMMVSHVLPHRGQYGMDQQSLQAMEGLVMDKRTFSPGAMAALKVLNYYKAAEKSRRGMHGDQESLIDELEKSLLNCTKNN